MSWYLINNYSGTLVHKLNFFLCFWRRWLESYSSFKLEFVNESKIFHNASVWEPNCWQINRIMNWDISIQYHIHNCRLYDILAPLMKSLSHRICVILYLWVQGKHRFWSWPWWTIRDSTHELFELSKCGQEENS